MTSKIHIGMRKIKSVLAVILSFAIWQALRCVLPMLEMHPTFAYVYSIIEMRESAQKTKDFGKLRVLATVIGLLVGLLFVTVSFYLTPDVSSELLKATVELVFVLLAALCSLCVAEMFGCKDFCGAAAIITVICIISRSQEDIYFYALMRVVQTLVGVFSAILINLCIRTKNGKS